MLFEAEASEGAQAAEDKECQFIHTRVHELFKDLVRVLHANISTSNPPSSLPIPVFQ